MNIPTMELLQTIRGRAAHFATKTAPSTRAREQWTDVTHADGMALATLVRGKRVTVLTEGERVFARPVVAAHSSFRPGRHLPTTGRVAHPQMFGRRQ